MPGAKRVVASLLCPHKEVTEEVIRAIERQKTLLPIALENDHLLLSAEIEKEISLDRLHRRQGPSDATTAEEQRSDFGRRPPCV